MKIAVIDADLITRSKHRFPNLACLKISGYWKKRGATVELKTDYNLLDEYDKVYISKVFTDTPVDDEVLTLPNVEYGGTGFYFDKAPNLLDEIEHSFPDYHLYDDFIAQKVEQGTKPSEFKMYTDYSIGFMTRGCFRKCAFCVNKKYDKAFLSSPLSEFYDPTRPKICLLDDNILSHPQWKSIINDLKQTGKPFIFKQGLDGRLLTNKKCEELCSVKYDGEITFAFDNVADYKLIEKKLQMIRKYSQQNFKFFVLVGFESQDEKDIENAFVRIEMLMKYKCLAYIMRSKDYEKSKYKGIYVQLARWCNQPNFFKKKSFREFCEANQKYVKTDKLCAAMRALTEFEKDHPEIAKKYFDIKWNC